MEYLNNTIRLVKNEYRKLYKFLYEYGDKPHTDLVELLITSISENYILTRVINQSIYRFEELTGIAYQDVAPEQVSMLIRLKELILKRTKILGGTEAFLELVDEPETTMTLENGRILGPREILEAGWLVEIFGNIRKTAQKIMLTSPYIDHTNPATIATVAAVNSEPVQEIILDRRFYGQFLSPAKTESAIEATGQPAANEARRTP